MKAILVIDPPNNCSECPCCNGYECGNQYKGYIGDYLKWNSGRPSWCPLKPMPNPITHYQVKVSFDYDEDYAHGWNDCFNAIMGETE